MQYIPNLINFQNWWISGIFRNVFTTYYYVIMALHTVCRICKEYIMSSVNIIKEWVKEKEYIQIFALTRNIANIEGKNNLEYRDVVIYSYISFRTKNGESTNKKKIEKKFCFDWDSIKKSISKLESYNLIKTEHNDSMYAREPDGECRNWFVFHKKIEKEKHWFDHITYYRMYITEKRAKKYHGEQMKDGKLHNKSMLSFKENSLYWILCSIGRQVDNNKDILVKEYQRKSGLAALCLMSERGVANALKRLIELGLVEQNGSKYIIHRPAPNQIYFWKTKATSTVESKNSKETTSQELILSKDLTYRLGGHINKNVLREMDRVGKLLVEKYGCENDYEKIRELFQYILDTYPIRKQTIFYEFIAHRLEQLIEIAHQKNKYNVSCIHLLRSNIDHAMTNWGG